MFLRVFVDERRLEASADDAGGCQIARRRASGELGFAQVIPGPLLSAWTPAGRVGSGAGAPARLREDLNVFVGLCPRAEGPTLVPAGPFGSRPFQLPGRRVAPSHLAQCASPAKRLVLGGRSMPNKMKKLSKRLKRLAKNPQKMSKKMKKVLA